MGPDLLPEVGGDASVLQGQRLLLQDFVHVHGSDGMLRGGYEVEVLILRLVHDRLEVPQVDDALVRPPPHHEGREDGDVSLPNDEVQGEALQGQIQEDEVTLHVEETGSRHLASPLEVSQARRLQELAVGFEFELGLRGLSPPPQLHVLRVILPHGDIFVKDIGQPHQGRVYLRPQGVHLPLETLDALAEVRGLLQQLGDFLPGPSRGGNLIGQHVPAVPHLVRPGVGLPPLLILLEKLLKEGEFLHVPALLQVPPDDLRGFADEIDIQHLPWEPSSQV